MKLRLGFISNSSSSSFIVEFLSLPKNVEEMMEMLFGTTNKNSLFPLIKEYEDDEQFTIDQIAKIVYDDFVKQKQLTKAETMRIIESGYFDGYPKFKYDYMNKEIHGETDEQRYVRIDKFHKAQDRKVRVAAKKLHNKFIASVANKHQLFDFEYSGNDGGIRHVMEYGNVFKRLKHLTISNH